MKIYSKLSKDRIFPPVSLEHVRSQFEIWSSSCQAREISIISWSNRSSFSISSLEIRFPVSLRIHTLVSRILASFHVQIKEIFLEDFRTCTESPLSDEFILSMLLVNKRLFSECIVDTEVFFISSVILFFM